MSILSPQSFPFGPNTMLEVLLLLLLLQSFDGVLVRVRVRTPRRILRKPVHKKKCAKEILTFLRYDLRVFFHSLLFSKASLICDR